MTESQSNEESAEADGTADGRTRTIELPAHVVDRVEGRIERTDFPSPGAYVAFVLEETLARVEAGERTGTDGDGDAAGERTERQVRSRLESLGYLE